MNNQAQYNGQIMPQNIAIPVEQVPQNPAVNEQMLEQQAMMQQQAAKAQQQAMIQQQQAQAQGQALVQQQAIMEQQAMMQQQQAVVQDQAMMQQQAIMEQQAAAQQQAMAMQTNQITNYIDFANTPVVDIVNKIIYDAAKAGASDIHFDHSDKCLKVRIRIDGILNDYIDIPNEVKNNIITRIKIISGMNITETRLPQDGAIKTTLYDLNLDMRVSSLPTKKGEKIVIRILDYTRSLQGIESLFFSEENYKKILQMLGEPNGIILVTGATGSGKSTTVYSFLQRLNVKGTNLITVEDPVEMDIEGINQVQVNSDIGLDFAYVLRSVLRQDPNVIMIGEIRDTETAQIAVRASITGHLVLSTLHTNNSLTTIERLLDMEVERYLLATALSGIISQKLARKLCDNCKHLRDTNKYEQEIFKKFLNMDIKQIYEPVGCPHCTGGYRGRIAIQEVLLISPDIRDAINARIPKAELRKLVYNSDVITLLQDGLYKVLAGFTSIEEIIKLTEADDELNAETKVKSVIENEKKNKEQ